MKSIKLRIDFFDKIMLDLKNENKEALFTYSFRGISDAAERKSAMAMLILFRLIN